jgi:hypothetical protein
MQTDLSLQIYKGKPAKQQEGMLISINSFIKEKPIEKKIKSWKVNKNKVPLFYTDPIFRAKEYDPL